MELVVAVLSGFVIALIAPWLYRVAHQSTGWLLAIFPSILFAYFLRNLELIGGGDVVRVSYAWVDSLDMNLSFYLDGLSLLFALLITGIGALVLVYAAGYLKDHSQLGRFYGFLLMFMASMLGVVLADNTLCLFLFWELTSISSFLLIGFEHERETSRASALQEPPETERIARKKPLGQQVAGSPREAEAARQPHEAFRYVGHERGTPNMIRERWQHRRDQLGHRDVGDPAADEERGCRPAG